MSASENRGRARRPAGFPEKQFPPVPCLEQEHAKRVRLGREVMKQRRAVFCGLARDVATALPRVLARIERAGRMFADHRVVIYENDSTDGTADLLHARAGDDGRLTVISERLAHPAWGSARSEERTAHMASYRNRCVDHVLARHGDFDHVVMLDLDLPRGFSYDGLASAFGYAGWHVMGANGISAPIHDSPPTDSMFCDAWAFRWPGDERSRPFEELNALRFLRGQPPFRVWSCFGGLAVYRLEALATGARYGGGDCEHVVLHRQLRESGWDEIYLHPSLFVLYG